MSLEYILRRCYSSAGIGSPDLNPEQVLWLKDIVNQAADELYYEKDLPLALEECDIKILSNTRIALPPFVGKVRAVRSKKFNDKWSLANIRTRYAGEDWVERWNKGRILYIRATAEEELDSGPGTINITTADPTVIVTIVGETLNSNNAIESITMDATTKAWTKQFTRIKSIKKNKIITENIIIKDSNETEVAIIYADQKDSRYVIMDISEYPRIHECVDGTFAMEVLYKPRLPVLFNNADEFPVDGFDNVVIERVKQLLAEDRPGEENRAILSFQKSERRVNKLIDDATGNTQKQFSVEPNGVLDLFRYGPYYYWDK